MAKEIIVDQLLWQANSNREMGVWFGIVHHSDGYDIFPSVLRSGEVLLWTQLTDGRWTSTMLFQPSGRSIQVWNKEK